jgi:hypothetical protein
MVNGNYISAEGKESELSKERASLEFFIGKGSKKLLKRVTNIPAGFLGPFYLLYRKCYIGYILLFLSSIVIYFIRHVDREILIGLYILNFIFYFFLTNTIYLIHAKRKIRKMNTNEEDPLKKAGGVSIVAPFLGILMVMVIYIFLFLFYWI